MTNVIELQTAGGNIRFEVDEPPTETRTRRVTRDGKHVIAELDQRLEDALASVRPAAAAIIETFQGLTPKSIEVEFGIKLNAEAGAIIAKTGVSGHFTTKLTWTPPSPSNTAQPAADQNQDNT